VVDFLKIDWNPLGIKAPALIWIGAGVLLAFTLFQLLRIFFAVWRERRGHARLIKRLDAIRQAHPRGPGNGLSMVAYDEARKAFQGVAGLESAWHAYDAHVLLARSHTGEDECWSPVSANSSFSEEAVLDARINRAFFAAVPGLVTGVGLLLTFLAILIALFEVRVDNNQVIGLENLIGGLSGKFISSIVALSAASLFLIVERSLFHRLADSRWRLVRAIDGLIPRRTELSVLNSLNDQMEEQSVAMRSLNTDLAPALNRSLSESMGPTLQRMAQTIDELNQLMRAAEAQKHESIAGTIQALLTRLEQSMTASLDRMGQQFTESLSGSATRQFDEASQSLGGLARVLSEMNAQSQATQAALSDLIAFARTSTQEQVALGRSQVEELTSVLRSLMAQMQEETGTSLSNMTAALTGVVHDLSTKVSDLGTQMATTVEQSSTQASDAAARVVEQASSWSERSAAQLAALLERHQDQATRMEDLRRLLDNTIGQVRTTVNEHAALAVEMRRMTGELVSVAERAAQSTDALRRTQDGFNQVAQLSASQVQYLSDANRKQEDAWRRVQASMELYERSFKEVDRVASQLLTQLADHVRDYTQTTKQGLETMVGASNELIGNAVSKLGGSIDDLDERLSDLGDILGRRIPQA
jgi:hypothetical protein